MIRKSAAVAIGTVMLSAISVAATAQTYILSCVSDKNFKTNFSVNIDAGTIMHLTSEDLDNGQTYEVYELEYIVYWENEFVSTFSVSSYPTFNLNRATYLNTGHYPDNAADEPTMHNQNFTCDRFDG